MLRGGQENLKNKKQTNKNLSIESLQIIREIRIKTTVTYHLMPVRMTISKKTRNKCSKDVEKRKPLCTVGGNVNWCSHYGKQSDSSSKV